jgi:hypothetical protein
MRNAGELPLCAVEQFKPAVPERSDPEGLAWRA